MRVLFDVVHPAHVHFFRNLACRLRSEGHSVVCAARDKKDVTIELLRALNLDFEILSTYGSGLLGLSSELVIRNSRLLRLARRFRPDVMFGGNGVTITLPGKLLGIPTVVLDEAEHAGLQRRIGLPLATVIITGTGYRHDLGARQRRFRGIWVQSYMAPPYFKPDPAPLRAAGIDHEKPYIVVRLVSWGAAHDRGITGASDAELCDAIARLECHGRVIVSSERVLTGNLASYRSPLPSEHVHQLLAYAAVHLGEGGTMAAEAAVLGTPTIYFNPLIAGYIDALARDYGLIQLAPSLPEAAHMADSLLSDVGLGARWHIRSERLLAESVDVTDWMYRLVCELARRPPSRPMTKPNFDTQLSASPRRT